MNTNTRREKSAFDLIGEAREAPRLTALAAVLVASREEIRKTAVRPSAVSKSASQAAKIAAVNRNIVRRQDPINRWEQQMIAKRRNVRLVARAW